MDDDRVYVSLCEKLAERVAALRGPVFQTDADSQGEGLFELYLARFPVELQQYYRCAACRGFISRFGGLVSIDEGGQTHPLLWVPSEAEGIMTPVVEALHRRVGEAAVCGVFLHAAPQWGRAVTGDWRHLAGTVDPSMVHAHPLLDANQRMAELREDFAMLGRALEAYATDTLAVAVRLLDSDQLFRSEKVLGVGQWLVTLDAQLRKVAGAGYRRAVSAKKKRARDNLLWRAVGSAPTGFCHVRSSMIGSLLEDIAKGMPFDAVERSFRAKMDPLQYQRPTAAPSAGNIREAEAIMAKLGTAGALERRFARLEDLQSTWSNPKLVVASDTAVSGGAAGSGAVFGHVAAKQKKTGKRARARAADNVPAQTMTWVKFRTKVLPKAARIELLVADNAQFYAFVTAVDPEAPPIIQWDTEQRRNPVTWYTHSTPPAARDWNVEPGWNELSAISLFPHQWFEDEDRFARHGLGVLLIIAGCWPKREGSGLFPEFMRSEYRSIRATLEAHNHAYQLREREQASACGIGVRANVKGVSLRVRVHPKGEGLPAEYKLDRWD